MTLAAATTPDSTGMLDVRPGWTQGRGAYGGLVVGSLVRAIEQQIGEPDRAVRSVTAELLAPLPVGPAQIAVEVLRRGNHVTIARAAIAGYAHAVGVLATQRKAAVGWQDLVPPEVPPFEALPEVAPPPGPEFIQHFDIRVVRGFPLGGGSETAGWLRARAPGHARDAGYVAAMIDAWYPIALVRLRQFRPMATLAFTLDIVGSLAGVPPDAPLVYRATSPVCTDGYALETRELWTADGRLIAINQQTFVVFA